MYSEVAQLGMEIGKLQLVLEQRDNYIRQLEEQLKQVQQQQAPPPNTGPK